MKVFTQRRDFTSLVTDVFVMTYRDEVSGATHWLQHDGTTVVLEASEEGATREFPPFISYPAWFPIHELADKLSARPEATGRHLDDAMAVRDRLLAIVERKVGEVA